MKDTFDNIEDIGNEANTFMHKYKGCSGLEFIVLSWDEDWPKKHLAIDPENGQGAFLLDTVETTRMVYAIPSCYESPENSVVMRRAARADGSPVLATEREPKKVG